jgi:muconolactone D-isomerase
VVQIPYDVDSEKIKALSAAEVERAKTLQREGKWLHIVYPYMKIKVIALCTHPASIETDGSTPSA